MTLKEQYVDFGCEAVPNRRTDILLHLLKDMDVFMKPLKAMQAAAKSTAASLASGSIHTSLHSTDASPEKARNSGTAVKLWKAMRASLGIPIRLRSPKATQAASKA